MTGGKGPEWMQAASLGIVIDPQNPLYAGGQVTDHFSVLGAPTLPIESLDPESLLEHSATQDMMGELDFDLGLSDSQSDHVVGEPDVLPNSATTNQDNFSKNEESDASNSLASSVSPNLIEDNFQNQENMPLSDQNNVDALNQTHPPASSLTPASLANASAPIEEKSHDEVEVGFGELNFDFDMPKSSSKALNPSVQHANAVVSETDQMTDYANQTSPSLDYLAGIDLDLPQTSEKLEASPLQAFTSGGSTEMATKLDLAVAYQEIGDKEGARELLEEVVKGGTQEQILRAKALMGELEANL
jgi:pilus assembly protein FimV